MAREFPSATPQRMDEQKFVVRLFELALRRARQGAERDEHPYDLASNASGVIDAYLEAEA